MLDECLGMLSDDFVEQSYNIYDKANEVDVFPALYSFYDMTWSLHPLLLTCMQAPDTAGAVLSSRFDDQSDIKLLITNVVHNVSLFMDTLKDLQAFFFTRSLERSPEAQIQGPYDAGFGAGRLVFYLIADNELAKQKDPAEGMDIVLWFEDETPEEETTPTEEETTSTDEGADADVDADAVTL